MTATTALKRRRKGQGDIIGLAFIVLILVIAFFIFISLKSKGGISSSVKSIQYNYLAQLELSAIINTNVQECNYPVSTLMKQCIKGRGGGSCTNDPCGLLNTYLNKMFKESFDKWGRRYRLYDDKGILNYPPASNGIANPTACSPNEDTLGVATQTIPIMTGNAELKLEICG